MAVRSRKNISNDRRKLAPRHPSMVLMALPALTDAQTIAEDAESIVRPNRVRPTEEAYSDILHAFGYFNERLFEGRLSAPLITFARKPRMLGAFCPNRFQRTSGESAHEIILNPQYLALRDDYDTLSTLVHEMAHQEREDFGPPGSGGKTVSNGYHDAVWADGMERIGLMPSHTGRPGGKRTGGRVSHYVIEGGPFDVAARELILSGFVIRWHDQLTPEDLAKGAGKDGSARPANKPKRKRDRIKFTCGGCGLNAWAKPAARLKCAPCDLGLTSESQEDKPS